MFYYVSSIRLKSLKLYIVSELYIKYFNESCRKRNYSPKMLNNVPEVISSLED